MFNDHESEPRAQVIDSEIYTAEQLAKLLKCDKEKAEEKMRKGVLPGLKFGKSWVVPRQALLKCLNEMAVAEAAQRRADEQAALATAIATGKAAAAPSPLLPTSEPPRKRGQRRAPPDLSGMLASAGLAC